ncbi:unnamed protein product [Hanseniaspora opuntiae]
MTFATPHLGVNFYKDGKFPYNVLTKLGSNVLGRSGRQLFLLDNKENANPLLLEISKGKYLEALQSFKHHIALANVHNDRSVSFYTSFITDLEYQCSSNALESDNLLVTWDKFPNEAIIDVTSKHIGETADSSSSTKNLVIKFTSVFKYLIKCLFIVFFVFIIFPMALLINTFGTIVSHINVWVYQNKMLLYSKFSFLNRKWLSTKLDLDLDPDSDFDEEYDNNEMEQLLNHLDKSRSEENLEKNDVADILSSDWETTKSVHNKDKNKALGKNPHKDLRLEYFIKQVLKQ